jgi:hypothetical protein
MGEVYEDMLAWCSAMEKEGVAGYVSEIETDLHRCPKDKKRKLKLRLPYFQETTILIRELMIVNAMQRWNTFIGTSCCTYHSCCDCLDEVRQNLKERKCPRSYGAYTDWQCSSCLALNAKDEVECETCGERNSSRYSSSKLSSNSWRLSSITEDAGHQRPHQEFVTL